MQITAKLSGLALGAVLLVAGPQAAYAASPATTLTAAQMKAALKAFAAPSQAAGAGGWRSKMTIAEGTMAMSVVTVVDTTDKIASTDADINGAKAKSYIVEKQGTYLLITEPDPKAALAMMHKPAVKYAFTAAADPNQDLTAYFAGLGATPAKLLTNDTAHAGTRTANADGSTDFAFRSGDEQIGVHVGANGTLTKITSSSSKAKVAFVFGYGPQTITTRPTTAESIPAIELLQGVAYLHLDKTIKDTADQAADAVRAAAPGQSVSLDVLRKTVQDTAAATNSIYKTMMITVRTVARGATMTATNPWTHETVTYAIETDGTTVTVTKK